MPLEIVKEKEKVNIVDIETLMPGECFRYFVPGKGFSDAVRDDGIFMVAKDGLETKDQITVVQLSGDYAVTKVPKRLLVVKVKAQIVLKKNKKGNR